MAFPQTLFLSSARGIRSDFSSSGSIHKPQLSATTAQVICPRSRCSQVAQRLEDDVSQKTTVLSLTRPGQSQRTAALRRLQCRVKTFKVEIIHEGVTHVLQVPEDETILSVAIEENLDVSYDCKLGVCMTCPAKLEKGEVDQSGGMLSEDVIDRGYALMCASYPLSDCEIRTIPEEELLALQLATAQDA